MRTPRPGMHSARAGRRTGPEHAMRTCFQRDRDRGSTAPPSGASSTDAGVRDHEGELPTRLTHSLEGADRRTVAGRGVNEELTECLCWPRTSGPPFGLGRRVLNELMGATTRLRAQRRRCAFLEVLEVRYPDFPGLNLREVREGIISHRADPTPRPPEYAPGRAHLEAQLVDTVDETPTQPRRDDADLRQFRSRDREVASSGAHDDPSRARGDQ